jgi:6-phosphogluconate dehydrogenase
MVGIEAQKLGVPATAIEAAVAARVVSSMKAEREAAEKAYGKPRKPKPNQSLCWKDLELALFAGKIAAYAQGFAVMTPPQGVRLESAAADHCQDLARRLHHPLAVPRPDRRSFSQSTPANLLMAPDFVEMMKKAHPSLRRVVALAAEAGLPVPALSSALAYFDGYRQAAARRT